MAMSHTEFDRRTDTLVDALKALTYLGDGLPSVPTVHKGSYRVASGEPSDEFAVHVARMGLPDFEYGTAGEPVIVTQEFVVAAVSNYPAEREDMEQYVAYFAANVVRALFANVQVTGTSGWHSGVITDSDAVRIRSGGNNTSEVETFGFLIKFEVDI